ncbi:hypothetical protein U5A82_02950 [Sphingobium sp. CR2-8]|uniref:hypothetical protein n=1 Tax=Sphingobium sp. CR2-8 TaxID=1306534 RepID=UPI002DBB5708|nr:hypothetical protein [Sphingobium sp. CR2-8]MEC3909466.1 hypothetical protein [Sphingobium sp. CR2-8]
MSGQSVWPKPLFSLISASHGQAAMERFRDAVPDDPAFELVCDIAKGMLHSVPPTGSSCVIMSALLAASLEEPLGTIVPVVAGALKLDSAYMYGSDRSFDGRRVFSGEDGEHWDGHCWILFGDLIIDISLGRTAVAGHCRPPLTGRILAVFGSRPGMIALTQKGARDVGLQYLPQYVLTPEQVLANAGGALQIFGLLKG